MIRILRSLLLCLLLSSCALAQLPDPIRISATQSVVVTVPDGGGMAKGSGTYLGDGLYVTAWHVVRDNPNAPVTITWKNGESMTGRVVGNDALYDIALVESERKIKGGVPLTQQNLAIGSRAYIGGYARTKLEMWASRVTGKASPGGNNPNDWIEATGQSIPGDSGGPIFDEHGCFVGNLWGGSPGRTVGNNAGRTQRFLLPWNARLAAWQSQGYGCQPGGYCPPQQPQQGGGGEGGRTIIQDQPGVPTPLPGGNNLGWPSGPPPQAQQPAQPIGPIQSITFAPITVEDLTEQLIEALANDERLRGPQGPAGPQGEPGQVTTEQLTAIASAITQQLRNDPALKGPKGDTGPMGPRGDGVSNAELEKIKADVLASLPPIRFVLADGSTGKIIDDETYAPGEPIVLDVQRIINAAGRQ